jgi:hypothetical protein
MIEKASFQTHGYTLLRPFMEGLDLAFLHNYALHAARSRKLDADDAVPGTPAFYGDPVMETLLEKAAPRIEAETGLALYPTYSYFRVYKHGDQLRRHKDRPACEISVTLSLGYDAEEPWPLWVDAGDGPLAAPLEPGQALLYKGTQIWHWREQFPGKHAAQVFLHYVDRNGPFSDWKFDRRAALRLPPVR